MPPITVTGANTTELSQIEQRLGLMIDQLDGVVAQGSTFSTRLVASWLGPIANIFSNNWHYRDLPSIDHVRDSLRELSQVVTTNRLDQERASSGADPSAVRNHRWIPPLGSNESRRIAGDKPFNQTEQQTSHNTFEHQTITEAFKGGDRAFELDIHRGRPNPIPRPLRGVATGLFSQGIDGDFYVYHNSVDPHTEVPTLRSGLEEIRDLDSSEPTTVFVDVKDELGGNHDSAVLDQVIEDSLGDQVFTPNDLITWAQHKHPEADITTVQDARTIAGWPTQAELEGKTIVVLTDNTAGYPVNEQSKAFIASNPDEIGNNTAFVNVPEGETSAAQVKQWKDEGLAVRTYPNGAIHGVSAGDPAPDLDGATFDAEDYNKPTPARDRAPIIGIAPAIGLDLLG